MAEAPQGHHSRLYLSYESIPPISWPSSTSETGIIDTILHDDEHHKTNHHTQLPPTPPASPPQLPTHPPTIDSPFTSPIVTLVVGGPDSPSRELEPVTFHVYADLLTGISPFFYAAFQGSSGSRAGFVEAKTKTMRLPEERLADTRFLLQWVYCKATARSVGFCGGTTGIPATTTPSAKNAVPENATATTTSSCASTIPTSRPDFSCCTSCCTSLSLYHPQIDPAIQRYQIFRHERRRLRRDAIATGSPTGAKSTISATSADPATAAESTTPPPHPHSPQSPVSPSLTRSQSPPLSSIPNPGKGTAPRRPKPPTFGPLIRLYILADRYDIQDGLREEICARVRDVGEAANCVPGRGDVDLLWRWISGGVGMGLGMDVGGGRGLVQHPVGSLTGKHGAEGGEAEECGMRLGHERRACGGGEERDVDLKSVVLEMNVRMRPGNFGRVLYEDDHDDDGEECQWDATFLRDLCLFLHRRQCCDVGRKGGKVDGVMGTDDQFEGKL